ncbi:MAG: ATP-binding cassette domain-containing protein, partial [Chitinophagaceae bacterium]
MMTTVKTDTFLEVNHITVRYLDKVLLPDLSFTMPERENIAIIGKSGSGKTTFLQTILGKYNIVNGTISYPFFESFKENHSIEDPLFTFRQLTAFVPQEARFKNKQNTTDFYYQQRFNSLDAEEAVTVNEYIGEAFSSVDKRIFSAGVRFPLEWIIQNLNLNYLLDKTVIQLSHGETRRLLIAQALLKQPLLLLLDNPLMGLDVNTRPFFFRLMSQITEKGTRIILTTTPHEIPDCITRVLEFEQGRIKEEWTRDNFFLKEREKKNIMWQPDQDKLLQLTKRRNNHQGNFKHVLRMEQV